PVSRHRTPLAGIRTPHRDRDGGRRGGRGAHLARAARVRRDPEAVQSARTHGLADGGVSDRRGARPRRSRGVTGAPHAEPLQNLREYRNLAPWNLRDLAALVGAVLDASAITPINAAARAQPSERTIRFYVTKGLVSPPEGRGTASPWAGAWSCISRRLTPWRDSAPTMRRSPRPYGRRSRNSSHRPTRRVDLPRNGVPMGSIIFLAVLVVVVGWLIGAYNGLI